MNNDEKLQHNEVNRGELARQVADNPIYQEALIAYKAKLMDDFQKTTFKQHDERDEIWRKMQTLNNFEGVFLQIMEDGRVAEATLAQKVKNVVGF